MKLKYSDERSVYHIHTDGIPYLSFRMLDRLGYPNLCSTRYMDYDEESGSGREGLRTVIMKEEDPQEAAPVIMKNRDALARQIGSSIQREFVTRQKHTNRVRVIPEGDPAARAPLPPDEPVDGIVTDIPGALLTAFGGDCPPVFLVDPVRKAAGLVHAGWKGTLGRIPAVAVAEMTRRFGCDPEDIYAAVGPGICRDCYEMGDEVYDAFAREWSSEEADRIFSRYPAYDAAGSPIPGGKYHLDLYEANRMTLTGAGLTPEHIVLSNVCTRCNSDHFYSYRARRMENEQAVMLVNRA